MPKDKGGIRRQMNWKQKVDKVSTFRTPTGRVRQLATTPVDTPTVAFSENSFLKAQRISAVFRRAVSPRGSQRPFLCPYRRPFHGPYQSWNHGPWQSRVYRFQNRLQNGSSSADSWDCPALFRCLVVEKKWMFWAKRLVKIIINRERFTIRSFLEITSSLIGHKFTFLMCN